MPRRRHNSARVTGSVWKGPAAQMATKISDNALSTERISRRSTTLLLGTNKSHSVCRHRSSTRRFPKCPVPPTTRTFLWTISPAILLKRLSFEQPEGQDESGQCEQAGCPDRPRGLNCRILKETGSYGVDLGAFGHDVISPVEHPVQKFRFDVFAVNHFPIHQQRRQRPDTKRGQDRQGNALLRKSRERSHGQHRSKTKSLNQPCDDELPRGHAGLPPQMRCDGRRGNECQEEEQRSATQETSGQDLPSARALGKDQFNPASFQCLNQQHGRCKKRQHEPYCPRKGHLLPEHHWDGERIWSSVRIWSEIPANVNDINAVRRLAKTHSSIEKECRHQRDPDEDDNQPALPGFFQCAPVRCPHIFNVPCRSQPE